MNPSRWQNLISPRIEVNLRATELFCIPMLCRCPRYSRISRWPISRGAGIFRKRGASACCPRPSPPGGIRYVTNCSNRINNSSEYAAKHFARVRDIQNIFELLLSDSWKVIRRRAAARISRRVLRSDHNFRLRLRGTFRHNLFPIAAFFYARAHSAPIFRVSLRRMSRHISGTLPESACARRSEIAFRISDCSRRKLACLCAPCVASIRRCRISDI